MSPPLRRTSPGASPLSEDFGPFDGRAWLDCAHQGPLPGAARRAGEQALHDKAAPHRIPDDAFRGLPDRLRRTIARVVDGDPDDVVLGNSTTYGLNLLVQGLPLDAGDEIVLVEGDFPATVITWLPLRERGVEIRMIRPSSGAPTADEVAAAVGPRTRVFCSSWVFSLSGHVIDVDPIGRVCRDAGVWFVMNASQGVGARPISVSRAPVDAVVSCGFKWLCGPYATGFAWMRPELRSSLRYRQGYWLTHLGGGDLRSGASYVLRDDVGASALDVFCPANFLNFMPWEASIELLLQAGIEEVAAHDQALIDRLLAGLPEEAYEIVSPRTPTSRSTLAVLRHRRTPSDELHRALGRAGVDVAVRDGKLRLSPHLYNDAGDIDRALEVLTTRRA